jgi:hypothetical protein
MRRAWVVGLGVIALALSPSAPSAANSSPELRLADRSPLTIDGRGFKPGERVRVTVHAAGVLRGKTASARRSGRFGVRFADLTLGPCTGFRVAAKGSLGSRAKLNPPPLPTCLPVVNPR